MADPPVSPETIAAANAWAQQHGCRTILACNKTPLAAFEAGMAAEREACARILDQHHAHYGCYAGLDAGKGTVVTSGLRPAAALLRKDPHAT